MKNLYLALKTLFYYYTFVFLKNKLFVTNIRGINYVIPTKLFETSITRKLLQGKFYEEHTARKIIQESYYSYSEEDCIVHAGAYIGDMLPYLATSGLQIYAFEPVREYYRIAQANVFLNDIEDRVHVSNVGLGAEKGDAFIKLQNEKGKNLGGSAMIAPDGEKVKIITLDSLDLMNVRVIHFDLEGYEIEALKGSLETIKLWHPVIFVEVGKYIGTQRYSDFFKTFNYKFVYHVDNNAVFKYRNR